MRVAIYARVSSERQAEKELSIPAQIKALKKYALDREWEVTAEFVDEAESARSANRPAFKRMITACKSNDKPFDAILVWKLSRFARNREGLGHPQVPSQAARDRGNFHERAGGRKSRRIPA